ncbi:uncharacterized protein LOC124162447 isoform X2 [Ischnura elegans]|nr:uncharacterized protein LOC124162447 isoform X2 [Ischnura elegans]XP_046394944.1 uncharacterized protein LOC124162447 isoform X2 [Ischnura elegans]XP_046394945.1 uncharacterized protein LOC124162447 isoform X2 [Ischnura elegans]
MAAHHMDAVYPEPLSRLHSSQLQQQLQHRRAIRKSPRRSGAATGRYRTQPVTFAEIKEVDEEALMADSDVRTERSTAAASSVTDLKTACTMDAAAPLPAPSTNMMRDERKQQQDEQGEGDEGRRRQQQPRPSV